MKSFSEFENLCADQRVVLPTEIINAGRRGSSTMHWTLEPDGLYAAVVQAGIMLRKSPGCELTNIPISLPEASDYATGPSVAETTLIDMINASIVPVPAESYDRYFITGTSPAISACSGAEWDFVRTFAQMEYPDETIKSRGDPTGYQIITGDNDEPIAVRKVTGQQSTLTLTDISINNIPYPPGSLLRAELSLDYDPQADYEWKPSAAGRARVSSDYVERAAFMRLSAFAIEPGERMVDFEPDLEFGIFSDSRPIENMLRFAPMEKLVDLAATALQSAEVLERPE
ncbi:MAG TPA: hypothetical protein VJP80_06210 [Candidatus Saccharimonadales bacterium]|nr:hypothetical protein [Candidatus Saccharimonadales bacterium]